jgi:HK97 family phage major capsid protein
MTSQTLQIPAFQVSDMSTSGTGAAGGLKAKWENETATLTPQDAKWRSMTLTAKKCTLFSLGSNEEIADAPSYETAISSVMGEAIGHKVESGFFSGTGAGQPLGFLNSPALITVAGETGQSTDTINAANIKKMYSRLLAGPHKRAVWFCNATALPEILCVGQPIGTGGAWVPFASFGPDGMLRLLNCPVIISEHCSALGDAGALCLCDMSYYGVGLRQELTLATSTHVAFQSDEKAYLCKTRLDGQPLLDKAYTPAKGSTLSPFVALGAV